MPFLTSFKKGTNMDTRSAYDKILSQNGFSEFKQLIPKWERLSQNLSVRPQGVPIILPDLFLVS